MAARRVTRHYYGSSSRFEQSLDVYLPTPSPPAADLPLVVLVVGSAWLGHSALIYRGTSWWNSSGPAAVARAGCVCVCVRHRGSFIGSPPLSVWLVLFVIALSGLWSSWTLLSSAALASLLLCVVNHLLARGAATYEQMLEDVSCALTWVRKHRSELIAPGAARAQRRMVFGGYSSGAHVAATLLTRPELLAPPGTPFDIDGVLLLSGVLGARAGRPLPAAYAASRARFVPDLLVRLVFGEAAAAALPSPVHSVGHLPKLPHLLIYCKHEVFNLQPLERGMGILFCSETYAEQLRARAIDTMQLPVESDHWSVLNSQGFARALNTAFIERKWPPSS